MPAPKTTLSAALLIVLASAAGAAPQGAPAAVPPAAASPVIVPEGDGAPVVTDGIFSPGEWDDALRIELRGGAALYLKEFRGVVFVGVRGSAAAEIGPSDLFLTAPPGPVWQLHVSAQLGEIVLPAEGEAPPFRFGFTNDWYANEFRRDEAAFERLRKEGRPFIEVMRGSQYRSEGIEFAIRRSKLPGPAWRMRLQASAFLAGKPGSITCPPDAKDRDSSTWLELRFVSRLHEALRNGDVAALQAVLDRDSAAVDRPDASLKL